MVGIALISSFLLLLVNSALGKNAKNGVVSEYPLTINAKLATSADINVQVTMATKLLKFTIKRPSGDCLTSNLLDNLVKYMYSGNTCTMKFAWNKNLFIMSDVSESLSTNMDISLNFGETKEDSKVTTIDNTKDMRLVEFCSYSSKKSGANYLANFTILKHQAGETPLCDIIIVFDEPPIEREEESTDSESFFSWWVIAPVIVVIIVIDIAIIAFCAYRKYKKKGSTKLINGQPVPPTTTSTKPTGQSKTKISVKGRIDKATGAAARRKSKPTKEKPENNTAALNVKNVKNKFKLFNKANVGNVQDNVNALEEELRNQDGKSVLSNHGNNANRTRKTNRKHQNRSNHEDVDESSGTHMNKTQKSIIEPVPDDASTCRDVESLQEDKYSSHYN